MGLRVDDVESESLPKSSADFDQGFRARFLRSPKPLGD